MALDVSELPQSVLKSKDVGVWSDAPAQNTDAYEPDRLLRARRERPRDRCAAEKRTELASLCMTEKEHAEGRLGLGHDRFPVATGSP